MRAEEEAELVAKTGKGDAGSNIQEGCWGALLRNLRRPWHPRLGLVCCEVEDAVPS